MTIYESGIIAHPQLWEVPREELIEGFTAVETEAMQAIERMCQGVLLQCEAIWARISYIPNRWERLVYSMYPCTDLEFWGITEQIRDIRDQVENILLRCEYMLTKREIPFLVVLRAYRKIAELSEWMEVIVSANRLPKEVLQARAS